MKITKIYGPPGTGKTTYLLATLKKLLEDGYQPTQIAYLSHSRAASLEVAERITRDYSSYNLKKDFPWFRTIHSACCRRLGISKPEIMSATHYKEFSKKYGWPLKGIIDDLSENTEINNYDLILNARSLASHWRLKMSETLPRLDPNPVYRNTAEFLQDYHDYKAENGLVDFVDMLEQAQSLGPIPNVKIYIVDEGQDLSELQLELIRNWSRDAHFLFIAGDDDQAIYTFLGSSERGFLHFEADEEVVLEKSYRCPQVVGRFAENIIRRVKDRRDKAVSWRQDCPGIVMTAPSWRSLPWSQAAGKGSVMILCRHRKQALIVGQTLLDMDVPCKIFGEPMVGIKMQALLNTYFSLRSGLHVPIVEAANLLTHLGFISEAKAMRLAASKNNEARISSGTMPISLKFNWPEKFAAGNDRAFRELRRLSRMIDVHGPDVINMQPNIEVTTYHQSKGREAETVVLLTDCYTNTWNEQAVRPDTETRLCYVGATRSKQKLIVCNNETDMYMKALLG